MTRPMVICGSCGGILRRDQGETEATRIDRHKAVGACRIRTQGKKAKPVEIGEPKPNLRSTLGGGWDA